MIIPNTHKKWPVRAVPALFDGITKLAGEYHLRRGHCCGSGCRHCPYEPKHQKGSWTVSGSTTENGDNTGSGSYLSI